jgi:selenocysteine lyase/cysteine desulfurase
MIHSAGSAVLVVLAMTPMAQASTVATISARNGQTIASTWSLAVMRAMAKAPHARLMPVTQVSNKTGLVTPVREIVAMARARGVDTVVDALVAALRAERAMFT